MLPTTYRGSATVDGENMEAELRLDDNHLRLALANGHHSELLRWPITNLQVKSTGGGDYLLEAGQQSFVFAPLVDDGLGDEIELRARFAALSPQADQGVTVSERVIAAGAAVRPRRRSGVLSGADLGVRSALVVLGILALVVVAVAAFSDSLGSGPAVVAVGDDPVIATPDSLPFTDGSTPATTPTPTSVPTPTTVPATVPTSIPPATTTTVPATTTPTPTTTPPTVQPVTQSAFGLTPQLLIAQWDSEALALGTGLVASEVNADSAGFSFRVGPYVEVRGDVDADGQVSSVTFLGDPSGTVQDDRAVLSALGLTVAMVEPSLPPDGRRQLIESLGLDVDNADLAGLDGSLTYLGIDYALRWDPGLARLVMETRPEGTEPNQPEASNLSADALFTM